MTGLIGILLIAALLIANFPFFTERLFGVIALKRQPKNLLWRFLELIVGYFLVGGIAYLLESQQGVVYHQHWQFYVATFCLFLVFAFPGMVVRYFWREPGV